MSRDDTYDAYEVTSTDGTQQLCTANTLDDVRAAARVQVEDGHWCVLYGATDFDTRQPLGYARNLWGKPVLYERAAGGDPWLVVPDS